MLTDLQRITASFPFRLDRLRLPVACGLLLIGLGGCAFLTSAQPPELSSAQIEAIIASPDRSAVDRQNDLRRKPQAMLAFIGIRPGMKALDTSAAGGYTTELLARSVGSSGIVYGQSPPRNSGQSAPAPAAPEGNSHPSMAPTVMTATPPPVMGPRRSSPDALAEREKNLQAKGADASHIVAVVQKFEDPAPVDRKADYFDVVTLMFNYHDLGFQGVDRAQMNRAIFAALKPGGMYVIADHAGRAGTGISESGTLHRIEEAFLMKEVQAAGFKLLSQGDFLRNPNDPRDMNTPNPPQPKDEFVLKFVRP